jgi:hypothetical protein
VTDQGGAGGQRRLARVLLLASAAAVLVTGLFGTVLVLGPLGGEAGALSPAFWLRLGASAALTIDSPAGGKRPA